MLRLTPPNYEKIRVATSFEASYGGSEANVALALANLGIDSTFFTVVPNNSLGKSAVRMLRSNDVHCSPVILSTPEETPSHRLFTFNILDRVGGGDAFASGLIYAMMKNYKPMDMINFAVASSAIKHTIRGDGNITDDAESIRQLMNMNYDIKR